MGAPPRPPPRSPPPLLPALLALWFLTSVASLFLAKHALHTTHLSEITFTACLFLSSGLFGLIATRLLHLAPLAPLTPTHAHAVIPLAAAYLLKEVLKYFAIARVSVNLINTTRSLGPAVTLALEYLLLSSRPAPRVLAALLPIVAGVTLTSLNELSIAHSAANSAVFLAGLAAAAASTVINQMQNMYSKSLFGAARTDPVSLQIHLSLLSLALLSPFLSLIHI